MRSKFERKTKPAWVCLVYVYRIYANILQKSECEFKIIVKCQDLTFIMVLQVSFA